MSHRIKEILKSNTMIYTLYMVYKMFRDENYKKYFLDYFRNGRIFRFEHLGEENQGKNIYFIQEGSSIQGMFSVILWTLRRLEVADRFHLTPVVSWTRDVPVNYNNHPNPFLIYFQPVSNIKEETIRRSADVAFSKDWDCAYGVRKKSYEFTQDEINRLSRIYKKYLKLQPELQKRIVYDIKALFDKKNDEKVLGVHIRGVEWRQKPVYGHPIVVSMQDYLETAQKMIDELGCEKIFLATDSEETVSLFKSNFGEKLIEYHAVRTPAGSSQLSIFNEKNDSFQMGYEVLRDVYTLASCDAMLCGLSNVSYVTRIIKQSSDRNFEKLIVLNKGRSSSGLSLKKVEEWQRNY